MATSWGQAVNLTGPYAAHNTRSLVSQGWYLMVSKETDAWHLRLNVMEGSMYTQDDDSVILVGTEKFAKPMLANETSEHYLQYVSLPSTYNPMTVERPFRKIGESPFLYLRGRDSDTSNAVYLFPYNPNDKQIVELVWQYMAAQEFGPQPRDKQDLTRLRIAKYEKQGRIARDILRYFGVMTT